MRVKTNRSVGGQCFQNALDPELVVAQEQMPVVVKSVGDFGFRIGHGIPDYSLMRLSRPYINYKGLFRESLNILVKLMPNNFQMRCFLCLQKDLYSYIILK